MVDSMLAVVALGATLALLSHDSGEGTRQLDVLGALLAACASLPLIRWRRWPLGVFVVTLLASALLMALGYPGGPPVGATIALYLLAASRDDAHPWKASTTTVVVASFVVHFAAFAVGHGSVPAVELAIAALVWAVAAGPSAVPSGAEHDRERRSRDRHGDRSDRPFAARWSARRRRGRAGSGSRRARHARGSPRRRGHADHGHVARDAAPARRRRRPGRLPDPPGGTDQRRATRHRCRTLDRRVRGRWPDADDPSPAIRRSLSSARRPRAARRSGSRETTGPTLC